MKEMTVKRDKERQGEKDSWFHRETKENTCWVGIKGRETGLKGPSQGPFT